MKIAILGVENSHADAFGRLVKENPKYTDIEIVGIYSMHSVFALFARYTALLMDNHWN